MHNKQQRAVIPERQETSKMSPVIYCPVYCAESFQAQKKETQKAKETELGFKDTKAARVHETEYLRAHSLTAKEF